MKKISVLPGFYISVAISLLIFPIPWVLAWITAAGIHELFHIAALYLCGYPVYCLRIGALGAQIESDVQPGVSMALCALAGPLAGLLLLLVLQRFPRIALCGLVQSAGNLLPVLPLDGGRGVYGILLKVFKEERAEKVFRIMEGIALIAVLVIALYGTIRWNLGIAPLAAAVVFLIRKKALAKKCSSEYNMVN